jgi:hypothetical protein
LNRLTTLAFEEACSLFNRLSKENVPEDTSGYDEISDEERTKLFREIRDGIVNGALHACEEAEQIFKSPE